ncbi:MAG: hypothetical protein ACOZIN_02875 [Myxococcota bacterium]
MTLRFVLTAALLYPVLAAAQDTPPIDTLPPPKKTIVVPVPAVSADEEEAARKKKEAEAKQAAPLGVPLPAESSAPQAEAPAPPSLPPAPEAAPLEEVPSLPLTPSEPPSAAEAAPEVPTGAMLDGHPREGAFLAGPGSLTFVLHHTILLGAGGLATQIANRGFQLDLASREAMLAGTLIGAGLGFGVSAWWQFNHWIDHPAATFGIVNSVTSAMFFTGLVDLFSNDPTLLTWTALLGAELGAWLTATIGGGEMPLHHGLLIASGGAWALLYASLLLAIIGTSSTTPDPTGVVNTLLIAPGIGAGAMALATMRYSPTTAQILRADVFGAGVGGAVLLLSALVLGNFKIPTPYVLSLLSSAGAIAAVSLLWEESAERPALYRDPEKDRPYRTVWW